MADLLGIDVGTNSVKVVRIEQKGKPVVVDAFSFPTPYDGGPAKISHKGIYDNIVGCIPLRELRNIEIAINIPSSRTIVLVVELPKMGKKEIEIAAINEARKKMLPTPGPDSIFEYLLLEEIMAGKIARYEVLIIKTEKSAIEDTLKLFEFFEGVLPALLSPACYTITNILSRGSDLYKQNSAFVDMGYESIDITVTKKGKLRFYRNIKFGVKDIVNHFASSLGLKPEIVQKMMYENGVPEISIDLKDKVKVAEEIMRQKYEASLKGEAGNEVNLIELRMLWDAEIERLVNEIRRSLIYYSEQTHGSRVDNVFIMGGGAQIKGVAPILKKSFAGLDILTPFSHIDINIKGKNKDYFNENQLLFAAAASLALSVPLAQRKKEVIDFLPEEIKKQKVVFQRQLSIIFVLIVIFALAFLAWLKVYMDNNILSGSISKLEFESKKSQAVIDTLKDQQSQKQSIDERLKEAQTIIKKRVDMRAALSELRRLMPPEVTLRSFKMGSAAPAGGPEIRGRKPRFARAYHAAIEAFCTADYEQGLKLANALTQALNGGVHFTNAQLVFAPIEAIKPVFSKEKVALTAAQTRNFTLSVDIKLSN